MYFSEENGISTVIRSNAFSLVEDFKVLLNLLANDVLSKSISTITIKVFFNLRKVARQSSNQKF